MNNVFLKRNLLHFSKIFVGLLFVFSGLVKLNDPLGFGYKLQEYFQVFHCIFLNDYATIIAILICSLEIVLGVLLLYGIWASAVSWGLLLLILFFTFLTCYAVFFEVVHTCGCFGDAIPLTPWQSFSKDLVLLALISIIFINRIHLKPLSQSKKMQQIIFGATVVLALGFGCYTYCYLPIIDFLPYKVGNNIPDLMKLPPGAPVDVYETSYTLKNKQTGEQQKMTDQQYLESNIWKNTDWQIIGTPSITLIKKGYDIKIKDLKITDSQGVDYTAEILENPYYHLIVVAYDLATTNERAFAQLNALAMDFAAQHHSRPILLTASTAEGALDFSKKKHLLMDLFYADAIPLKSMVRANPGMLLLKDGMVIKKWSRNIPSYKELQDIFKHSN